MKSDWNRLLNWLETSNHSRHDTSDSHSQTAPPAALSIPPRSTRSAPFSSASFRDSILRQLHSIKHQRGSTHRQTHLMLIRNPHNLRDIILVAQLFQCSSDMFTGNGLFGVLLCYLVCFTGDKTDEFDATIDEEVAGIAGEGDAAV